jgi:hypothetical protein
VDGFVGWNHAEKIPFFAWYLHTYKNREAFAAPDIGQCYDALNIAQPAGIGPFLKRMKDRRELLPSGNGYKLEHRIRTSFDAKYAKRPATIIVDKLLSDLPARIPDLTEQAYLEEAVRCMRCEAFRAAMVMGWNLAYDHLCQVILKPHNLSRFNARLVTQYAKQKPEPITNREDFHEWKESQVIEICHLTDIVTKNMWQILNEKLTRRNMYAHPSGVTAPQAYAEGFITDLVENVVLRLK